MSFSENSSDIVEQLTYLKRLSEMTGVLHEAQVMHIKLYWGLLSDGYGKKLSIDFDNKSIEFLMPDTGVINSDMIVPFKEAMTFLLGNSWSYRFFKGNEEMFI